MRVRFRDRVEAGRELADALGHYADRSDVVVLGLPRGGVPVAFEVAKKLRAPLDVFVVRKLGVPGQPELAMGAIATGGVRVLNKRLMDQVGITDGMLEKVVARETAELRRREIAYRGHGASPDLDGKTVILVDDGIATGSTMGAAIQALRLQSPEQIVVAVPTASPTSYEEFIDVSDELVVLMTPYEFYAVGQSYEDFSQTSDDEVTTLLERARSANAAALAD